MQSEKSRLLAYTKNVRITTRTESLASGKSQYKNVRDRLSKGSHAADPEFLAATQGGRRTDYASNSVHKIIRKQTAVPPFSVPADAQLISGNEWYVTEERATKFDLTETTANGKECQVFLTDVDIERLCDNDTYFIDGTFDGIYTFSHKILVKPRLPLGFADVSDLVNSDFAEKLHPQKLRSKIKMENLVKNRQFSQKSKIWSKIDNLVKTRKFGLK